MASKACNKAETLMNCEALMVQSRKDSAIHSLLYVTRKLGEVEGLVSIQTDPDENLIKVQKDLLGLYDQLIETAGIQIMPESERSSIGGDSS